MSKPIPDKAELALEYPDKFYRGTFERTARFDAHLDATGMALMLQSGVDPDSRKSVHLHINYELLADILRDLAATVAGMRADDQVHRSSLAEAVEMLHRALQGAATKPAAR